MVSNWGDRIPPGYGVVAFKKKEIEVIVKSK
jgi:hypothetical protein